MFCVLWGFCLLFCFVLFFVLIFCIFYCTETGFLTGRQSEQSDGRLLMLIKSNIGLVSSRDGETLGRGRSYLKG